MYYFCYFLFPVILTLNLSSAPDIDLGIIENLQVVTFISYFGREPWFYKILKYLKNPSVTKSLKEFTIGIIFDYDELIRWPNFEGWKCLDAILFSLPTLQKVLTVLVGFTSTSQLPSIIQGRLPLLESCGILSVVSGTIRDLQGF
jgi:hypothetical protein